MKNWDLKNLLKNFKLNESNISMALGALVIIVVGVLVVNYFKGNSGDLLTGLTDSQNQEDANSHTVAKGETLWSIAEDVYGSGFEWSRIAEANNLKEPYALEEGQVLTLPEKTTAEASVEPSVAASPTTVAEETPEASPIAIASPEATVSPTPATMDNEHSTEPISAATYTVVHGDNLWTIATRAYGDGYKWTEIAKENNLLNPNLIHAGNVLILPR